MEIKNRFALVAGGASGLGAACVRMLLAEGATKVVVLDCNGATGAQISEELGESVLFIKTDVSIDDAVKSAVDQAVDAFGALYIVINCAGVVGPCKLLSRKKGLMAFEHFANVINVNLIGTMNIVRHTIDKMVHNDPVNDDGEKGVVINTASISAFEGQIGQAAYSASKGGVVGMTLPLARECAEYGIRIMAIAPGIFNTPMIVGLPDPAREALAQTTPFPKRLGEPKEFAALAKCIIETTMFSGETIRLDGAVRLEP